MKTRNNNFTFTKNPFTALFNQHLNYVDNQLSQVLKLSRKLVSARVKLDVLLSKYDSIVKETKKEKTLKKIEKQKKIISKLTNDSNIAFKKRARHAELSKHTYALAGQESAMKLARIKNKNWLSLDQSVKKSIDLGSNIEDKKEFSISFWFRTDLSQNDKRILNSGYKGSMSSLIVGLKSEKVFFGYRDSEEKYITQDYELNYSTNEWQNFIVTYNQSKFEIYINGELRDSIEDGFVGLNEEPSYLGSYQFRSHHYLGDIDELSLWKTALSPDSAQDIYNDGVPSNLVLHSEHANIVKWWRMGDKIKRSIAGSLIDHE